MEQQRKENSPIPSSGGTPTFASVVLSLVGFHILIPLFGIILSSIPVLKEWRAGTLFIGEGAMLLSVFAVTSLIMQSLDHRPFSDLGSSPKGHDKGTLYGFLMVVFIYAIGLAVCLLTGQTGVVGVHFHWSDLFLSGLFFAMVAIVEETVVHGYILGRLLHTRLNKFISPFISLFLFASLYLINPNAAFLPMLNPVLRRLLLGTAYLYTRSPWPLISFHFLWNWIQESIFGFEVGDNCFRETLFSLRLLADNLINGGAFGLKDSLVCTAPATLSTLLITWWLEQ